MMAKLEIPEELLTEFIEYVLGEGIPEGKVEVLLMNFVNDILALLPCPFFADHVATLDYNNGLQYFYVFCPTCKTEGPESDSPILAAELWNTRKSGDGCVWCGFQETINIPSATGGYFTGCANINCNGIGPKADAPEEAERLWKNRTR
jgi:hypothetical protein